MNLKKTNSENKLRKQTQKDRKNIKTKNKKQ